MEINLNNPIFTLDQYKWDHAPLYKDGLDFNYAHGIFRNMSFADRFIVFGVMYQTKRWLMRGVTQADVDEAREAASFTFDDEECFNHEMWQRVVDECGGKFPLEITCLPEGSAVKPKVCYMDITNTKKGFAPVASSVETLYQHVWYTSIIATHTRQIVEDIKSFTDETSDIHGIHSVLLADFGQRSATCMEQAGLGGMAILLSTMSSDTSMAFLYATKYYNANKNTLMKSVRANEHSVTTGFGRDDKGCILDGIKKIKKKSKGGIYSFVSDTNGIINFMENVVPQCKAEILDFHETGTRALNKIVFRPDSDRYEGDTPAEQVLWIVETLDKTFGHTVNNKGYKVLHPAVGCIYGDSLDRKKIRAIYQLLKDNKWSAENTLVGSGGGLMQKGFDRDEIGSAIKASEQTFDGVVTPIKKNTLDEFKRSKGGRMKVIKVDGEFVNITSEDPDFDTHEDLKVVFFRDGEIFNEECFETIRERMDIW